MGLTVARRAHEAAGVLSSCQLMLAPSKAGEALGQALVVQPFFAQAGALAPARRFPPRAPGGYSSSHL